MCFFSSLLQFETKFHVNALFVIHDLWQTLKHTFSQPHLTTDWLHQTSWNLSQTVTEVWHATSHFEDPCLSVGSHSAAAASLYFLNTVVCMYVCMYVCLYLRMYLCKYVCGYNFSKSFFLFFLSFFIFSCFFLYFFLSVILSLFLSFLTILPHPQPYLHFPFECNYSKFITGSTECCHTFYECWPQARWNHSNQHASRMGENGNGWTKCNYDCGRKCQQHHQNSFFSEWATQWKVHSVRWKRGALVIHCVLLSR